MYNVLCPNPFIASKILLNSAQGCQLTKVKCRLLILYIYDKQTEATVISFNSSNVQSGP